MSIQELRARTGAGMSACASALKEAGGDVEKAIVTLRKKGEAKADSFTGRSTTAGVVGSYIHHDKSVGVMVVLACETDFVARTPEFQELANNIAMHVMASNPVSVTIAGMDDEALFTEHEIARSDLEKRGMSGEKLKKAFQGKMQKIFSEKVLIEQPFVLDSKQTVGQVVKAFSAKCGEKVEIKSFTRTSI
jgi:elongation factor Ts